MNFRRGSRILAAIAGLLALSIVLAACGGASSKTGTDKTSGLSVTIKGTKVTVSRTAKSTSGTAGVAGQVGCTDDYAKVAKASAVPAPSVAWYAATLITWPDTGKSTTATLSHKLKGDPDLCIVQTADQSAQVVVYFSTAAKTGIQKVQDDTAKTNQASQASAALTAAAQAAAATVTKKKFPAAAVVLTSIKAQGLYAAAASSISDVKVKGTIYLVDDETTSTKVTLALMDSTGKINKAVQGVSGSPKTSTVK